MPSLVASYPDNPRAEWVTEFSVQPIRQANGLIHFEYSVWPTQQSRLRGDLPFLLNSHKAMIRETHQRILQPAPGSYRHISGIDVPARDLDSFLESDARAYRWVSESLDEWEDDRQRRLNPFLFNTYWGAPEGLDPQWVRETFVVSQAQQVSALIATYLARAEEQRLSGDHRGTTLNLQVAASTDDAYEDESTGVPQVTAANVHCNSSTSAASRLWTGARFQNGDLSQGDTINTCTAQWSCDHNGRKDANLDIYFEKVASPAAFAANDTDITGRTLSAGAAWVEDTVVPTTPNWATTPSLVTPLQDVADDVDPTALALIFKPKSDVTKLLRGESYDGDTSLAIKLDIDYTAGAAGRTMGALAGLGGLAGAGGIAGRRGGIAG